MRRCHRSSATVQPFCFTFSQRVVAPPSYALASCLATYPLVPALDHLLPRLQAVRRQSVHREHQLAAGDDVLQPGAAVAERPRGYVPAVTSRPSRLPSLPGTRLADVVPQVPKPSRDDQDIDEIAHRLTWEALVRHTADVRSRAVEARLVSQELRANARRRRRRPRTAPESTGR
jgi:hypothetical protein